MKNLLAFSGSSRLNSINQSLLQALVRLAREKGAVVETLDLKSLHLPIYDGDIEAANGLPDGAKVLKEAMRTADGFIITSPEYNSFPTPLLLNAIDWASRPEHPDEPPLVAFKKKSAALFATSPGPMGGQRSLWALRTKLQNIGVTVVPSLVGIGSGNQDMFVDPEFGSSSSGKRAQSALDALLSLQV